MLPLVRTYGERTVETAVWGLCGIPPLLCGTFEFNKVNRFLFVEGQ